MLQTIVIILMVWWLIHFAFYLAGKAVIRQASEQELISIFSSPLVAYGKNRKWSKSETWAVVIGVIAAVLLSFGIRFILFDIQELVVFTTSAHYFSEASFVLPAIIISFGLVYLYWLWTARRVKTKEGSEYWRRQPAIKEITFRVKRLKRKLTYVSIFGQFLFVLNMLSYAQIDETGVTCSPIYTVQSYHYPFDSIKHARMYVQESTRNSRGRTYKVYTPFLKLYFKNNQRVNLWKSIHWSEKEYLSLKEALVFLQENRVPLEIDTPSILEKSKYRDYFRRDIYDEIMAMFTYAESVREDRYIPIALGKTLKLDDIDITIDSTVADYGEGFMSPTKGNRFEMVHLSVKNNEADTFILVQMNMHVYDTNDIEYSHSLWARDTFNSYIPPYETHRGTIAFMVPDTASQLRLKYQLGFMNKRFLWFDLSKNSPEDVENQ